MGLGRVWGGLGARLQFVLVQVISLVRPNVGPALFPSLVIVKRRLSTLQLPLCQKRLRYA